MSPSSSPWGDPLQPLPDPSRPVTRPYEPAGRAHDPEADSRGGAYGSYRRSSRGQATALEDDPRVLEWQDDDDGPGAVLRRPLGYSRDPGRLFRTARASVALVVIALGLGLALASAFGLVFWAVASAIHGASS